MAAVLPQKNNGTYTFANQPRAIHQKKKFREGSLQEQAGVFGNIMYDRRVVRGNTYAQHTLPAHAQPDPIQIQQQQEARRRAIAKKRAREQLRPKSPDAVEGRKHVDAQTELYLEELTDRVEEADIDTQTDAFLDRPPSPLYVPAKSGNDVATQILEGDLFDFDVEVKPVLEVLVGKTVEQALLEVMEEEELANLRSQQRAFEELRNAELVEQQRLEERERRHREEKERRMKQQAEVLRAERETAEKIAARAFAQAYLSDLVPSVFGTLADNGYFYDPVERDLEAAFLPWMNERVEVEVNKHVDGRMVLDGIIRDLVTKRQQMLDAIKEAEERASAEAEAAAKAAAEQAAADQAAAEQAAVDSALQEQQAEAPAAEAGDNQSVTASQQGDGENTEQRPEGIPTIEAPDGQDESAEQEVEAEEEENVDE